MAKMPNMNRRIVLQTLCCLGTLVPLAWSARNFINIPWDSVTAGKKDVLTESRAIMGTVVSITVAQGSRDQMQDAMGKAFERIDSLIGVFDRRGFSSALSSFNQYGFLKNAPPDLVNLLVRSQEYGTMTGGAFNIAVQPLVDLWQRYANPQGIMNIPASELRAAQELSRPNALNIVGRDLSFARSGMGLTLDGIAKGHIADEVSRLLLEQGVLHHLVNAGGDIVARGEKSPGTAWTVAVENPAAADNPALRQSHPHVAVLPLRNQAIATSGSYRVFFDAERRHNHLVDVSGASPTSLISATVLASNAAEADALATALAVMNPVDGVRLMDAWSGAGARVQAEPRSCLLVEAGGRQIKSQGWPI